MRRCPRCTYPLKVVHDGLSELDQCHRCHGAWLLPRDAIRQFGQGADPSRWQAMNIAESRGPSSLTCPDEHGPLEILILRDEQGAVELDTCRQCEGLWLDASEGRTLSRIVREQAEGSKPYSPDAKGYLFQLLTGFPVEEWNPVRRPPIVVISLVVAVLGAAITQLWLAYGATPEEQSAFAESMFAVPATIMNGDAPWTLVTYMFFHAGVFHLLGNLWFLWLFGDNVEDMIGRGKTLALYLAAGLAGILTHVIAFPADTTPVVGASAAIAGLMGAYCVLFPRVRVWVVWLFIPHRLRVSTYILIWVGIQLVGILLGQGSVAWWAHLGGFLAGALMALALRSDSRDRDLMVATQPARRHRAKPWERPGHANRKRYASRSAGSQD